MLKNSKVVLFLSPSKVSQAGNFWTLLRMYSRSFIVMVNSNNLSTYLPISVKFLIQHSCCCEKLFSIELFLSTGGSLMFRWQETAINVENMTF